MPDALNERQERLRLQAVHALDLLDTRPEERFDRVVRIAKWGFRVSTALVSLIDAKRQWYKAREGPGKSEIPREESFCNQTIRRDEPLVVPDATQDSRFASLPAVTRENGVRFYAGVSIRGPGGFRVGTLCITDNRPRTLSTVDHEALVNLAAIAEGEINVAATERAAASAKREEQRLRSLSDSLLDGLLTVDQSMRVTSANRAVERILGRALVDIIGGNASAFCSEQSRPALEALVSGASRRGARQQISVLSRGQIIPVVVSVAPLEGSDGHEVIIEMRDITHEAATGRHDAAVVEVGRRLLDAKGAAGIAVAMAEGLAETLADWALVAVIDEGTLHEELRVREHAPVDAGALRSELHDLLRLHATPEELRVEGDARFREDLLIASPPSPPVVEAAHTASVSAAPFRVRDRFTGLTVAGTLPGSPVMTEADGRALATVGRLAAFLLETGSAG